MSQPSQRTRGRRSEAVASSQASQSSQSTQRASQRNREDRDETLSQAPDVNAHEIARYTTEVLQYFLIMEQKRFPVKKADITKMLGLKGNSNKTFKAVMTQASKYLENVSSKIL